MKYRSRWGLIAAAVSGLSLYGAAFAGTDTASLTVTASVAPVCHLTTAPTLGFGALNPAGVNNAQADITYWCTNGTNATITLGAGGGGSINTRKMGTLPYQLYTTFARTAIFGDGTTGNSVSVTGAGYSVAGNTVTVYGQVLQADAAVAAAGGYSDTVPITITF